MMVDILEGGRGLTGTEVIVDKENIAVAKVKEDPEREQHIDMEIVVDAYDECERAMGWYYYLEDHLRFPFAASCISKRAISPLRAKDEVEVLSMAPEDECEHEMFVMIRWERDGLAVPLSQLVPIDVDAETKQTVKDWHYWVARGYRF
jgi:hypothetical protein